VKSSELYTRTAAHYDRTRAAVGVEIILGCLAAAGGRDGHGMELHRQTIVDAGCGTGNYARALASHVGAVHAVDQSAAMLAQARAKVGDGGGDINPRHPRSLLSGGGDGGSDGNGDGCGDGGDGGDGDSASITFHRATLDNLPVDDGAVDGITVNQVLHHLSGESAVAAALAEFHRALRLGGALIINTCSHRQLRHGFWPYKLLPKAALEAMLARHVDAPKLREMLAATGFKQRALIVPLDAVLQGDAYFNAHGPADAEWRSGDSIWSLLSSDETAAVEQRITDLARADALDNFMRDADTTRADCGQISFVFAVKV